MKKYFTLVLTVILTAVLLAGCSSNYDDAEYLKDLSAGKIVTLGQYKGIEVFISDILVTDEEVDGALAQLLITYPMLLEVDGPGEAGDEVIIDFIGTVDGEAFSGGTAYDNPYTLGSYQFIPDLCEGMIGMSVGDVWDIPVTFPEEYQNADLAGVLANFQVTMNKIERPSFIPEITDEYVVWFTEGTYADVASFSAYMRENMEYEAEMNYENEIGTQIATAVLDNAEFKALPSAMVNRINEALINQLSYYAMMYGIDIETYMMLAGISGGDVPAEQIIAEQAEQTAKHYLAYQAIADIEGLTITDEDVNLGIAELAAAAGMTVEEYSVGMDVESYREYLMIEKVFDFLLANAVLINI
ncbi:MAG: trigger factor [Lachnospiraceae bacterium]|nr:trigger factor [Lachnospiraceae bacterium]